MRVVNLGTPVVRHVNLMLTGIGLETKMKP